LKGRRASFKAAEALLAKAHTRDSLQAMGKLTTATDGARRIISDPPLIVRLEELSGFDVDVLLGRIRGLLATYRETRSPTDAASSISSLSPTLRSVGPRLGAGYRSGGCTRLAGGTGL
jgi:hypothetical protein